LADLDDLDESVRAVEESPSLFGLSLDQVRRRRGFVDQVKDQIEELRDLSRKAYNVDVVCLFVCIQWVIV
jgi:Syntaxin 6, N-terminal